MGGWGWRNDNGGNQERDRKRKGQMVRVGSWVTVRKTGRLLPF